LTIFGIGLALMVAPLTATVLAAAPDENTGIASGINNMVARTGSLLAVAALPVVVGLSGDDYADPVVFNEAFREAIVICAVLLVLGGIVSWLTIPGSLEEANRESSAAERVLPAEPSLTNRCVPGPPTLGG
jgi:MFS family permease